VAAKRKLKTTAASLLIDIASQSDVENELDIGCSSSLLPHFQTGGVNHDNSGFMCTGDPLRLTEK
jgi:hypothetical protein